jgi:hypothetical protein
MYVRLVTRLVTPTRVVTAVAAMLLLAAPPAAAVTFTVTTTADSGAGSLRQAIDDANATVGSDTIAFDIPQEACDIFDGICELEILSDLPEITGGLVVDGVTQPRYGLAPDNVCATANAPLRPRVEITGNVDTIFRVTSADRVTIRGLALGRANYPIRAESGGRVTVQCNLFGLSIDGDTRLGFNTAVCIGCFGSTANPSIIGTDGDGANDTTEGNVFAAGATGVNVTAGIDTVIAGNLFGVRPDGVTPDAVATGVHFRQTARNNLVGTNGDGMSDTAERNVFAYATRGVLIASRAGAGDGNRVVGNWIGLDAEGESGNVTTGIQLQEGGQNHLIARNRLESTNLGILIQGGASLDAGSTDNCIADNTIGLSHEGSVANLAASLNWWGASSGPSGIGPGTGDSIQVTGAGSVDFEPWLTGPAAGCTGDADGGNRIVVPAAAVIRGAQGSFFVTDLEVHNGGSSATTFQLWWLPRDEDNSTPATSAPFEIEAGESLRFANVLQSVFGLDQVAGALLVESTSTRLSVMSRTFNRSPEGTFGQSLPGVPGSRLVTTGETARVLFMDENADYRSNLGLVNGTPRSITIRYELFRSSGASLGTASLTLPPWGNTQINRVFVDSQPIEAGYVDVWTETGDGAFTCYGSVLDNRTSDPTTVLPQ